MIFNHRAVAMLNRQYAADSYFVYVLEIEHGWNFCLKVPFGMIINMYHKDYFWNPSMSKAIFRPIDLLNKSVDLGPKIQIQ